MTIIECEKCGGRATHWCDDCASCICIRCAHSVENSEHDLCKGCLERRKRVQKMRDRG